MYLSGRQSVFSNVMKMHTAKWQLYAGAMVRNLFQTLRLLRCIIENAKGGLSDLLAGRIYR